MRTFLTCLVIAIPLLFGGCERPAVKFAANKVLIQSLQPEEQALQDIEHDVDLILQSVFGTPDQPHVPRVLVDAGLVSPELVKRAAGAVSSDRDGLDHGLYRKHCVACHGLTGDGNGPASAMLNPYPRDFRLGIFKFKSTKNGSKPTRSDLIRTIRHGLTGTSMPSFDLYPDEDIEALVDYVIYLTVRGELERTLYRDAVAEFGYGDTELDPRDRLIDTSLKASDQESYERQISGIRSIVSRSAQRWVKAKGDVVEVPAPQIPILPLEADAGAQSQRAVQDSIERGRSLFIGKVANCSVCHGEQGKGNGQENDYDDWTKSWTLRMGIDPKDPKNEEKIREFVKVGAQRPRNILPRDFTLGSFKGGAEPEDIYRRIVQGIDGTPMPGINLVDAPSPTGVTANQVWDLVNYVLSLSEGSIEHE